MCTVLDLLLALQKGLPRMLWDDRNFVLFQDIEVILKFERKQSDSIANNKTTVPKQKVKLKLEYYPGDLIILKNFHAGTFFQSLHFP